MVSVKTLIGSAAAVMVSTAAFAADLGPPPAMQYQPQAQVLPQSGWYLRGDVGVGVQSLSSFDLGPPSAVPADWRIDQRDIQDATIFGMGAGYVFNNWLRFDVTGEYRTKAGFSAIGSYNHNTCNVNGVIGTCFDSFTGNFSAAVFMANAYVDLGTWWCLTPFIGAGVGGAFNNISSVQDLGIIAGGTTGFGLTSHDNSMWTLAWDVTAGLTYNVNDNLKVDFSWRFLNMGSPQTAVVFCQNTAACPGAFYTLRDLTSQDFRIGLRWMFQPGALFGVAAVGAPVFAAPQYVQPQYAPVPPPQYVPAPQPQYAPYQPPLSSRG
jgi:opacity protein-like surface antigen